MSWRDRIERQSYEDWMNEMAADVERDSEMETEMQDEPAWDVWRPIESAPMDGTVVMLYGHGRVTVGSWVAEHDIMVSDHSGCYPSGETLPAYWQSHDGGFTEEHPATHWMPLPQPPREKEGGGA